MSHRRRLESVAALLSPEEVPTACFFAADRFRAESGFGGQTAAEVLDAVEAVDGTIRLVDELRATQHLDLIDTAILIRQEAFAFYAQDAQAIAGSLVEAFWNWDKDRYGADSAWRQQRSPGQFEAIVAGRLARTAGS